MYKRLFFYFCLCFLGLLGLAFSIDRTIARRDWLNGRLAEGCIFETNCYYYNNLER